MIADTEVRLHVERTEWEDVQLVVFKNNIEKQRDGTLDIHLSHDNAVRMCYTILTELGMTIHFSDRRVGMEL